MNQAITMEVQFFFISVLSGALLLMAYDILRVFRRLIKHGEFSVALEDLVFWVVAGLSIFIMMYKENNGIIRGFSIMGMAIGTILYHFVLSEAFVNILTKLIKTLISPLVFLIKQFIKTGKLVGRKVKKVVFRINNQLKKWTQSVRIKLSAKHQATLLKKQKKLESKNQKKKRADDIKLAKKKAKEKNRNKKNPKKTPAQKKDGQIDGERRTGRTVEVKPIPIKNKR